MKKHNFSAGPCILPQEVFQKSSEAILDFEGTGLSILEISHRSKEFIAIMEEARDTVKKLLKLNDNFEVLFLAGGASLEFLMTAYNLLTIDGKAAYLDTGTWSDKAIKEAKKLGKVDVIASSKDENYKYIPKGYTIDPSYDYFHCTSNNTIFGTQMHQFPDTDVPLVCDMSSDIFSRTLDFNKFGLIYAGAQKNLGPAGTTLVVVNKNILGKTGRDIPSYLDYQMQISKDSMFNTPPVFPIYASLLNLRIMDREGGIETFEKKNNKKAELLYNAIDSNPMFESLCNKEDRSKMNVVFNITDESKKERFDQLWKEAGIVGLNGHRSVGGYRASIYNAMPKESVEVLIQVMNNV